MFSHALFSFTAFTLQSPGLRSSRMDLFHFRFHLDHMVLSVHSHACGSFTWSGSHVRVLPLPGSPRTPLLLTVFSFCLSHLDLFLDSLRMVTLAFTFTWFVLLRSFAHVFSFSDRFMHWIVCRSRSLDHGSHTRGSPLCHSVTHTLTLDHWLHAPLAASCALWITSPRISDRGSADPFMDLLQFCATRCTVHTSHVCVLPLFTRHAVAFCTPGSHLLRLHASFTLPRICGLHLDHFRTLIAPFALGSLSLFSGSRICIVFISSPFSLSVAHCLDLVSFSTLSPGSSPFMLRSRFAFCLAWFTWFAHLSFTRITVHLFSPGLYRFLVCLLAVHARITSRVFVCTLSFTLRTRRFALDLPLVRFTGSRFARHSLPRIWFLVLDFTRSRSLRSGSFSRHCIFTHLAHWIVFSPRTVTSRRSRITHHAFWLRSPRSRSLSLPHSFCADALAWITRAGSFYCVLRFTRSCLPGSAPDPLCTHAPRVFSTRYTHLWIAHADRCTGSFSLSLFLFLVHSPGSLHVLTRFTGLVCTHYAPRLVLPRLRSCVHARLRTSFGSRWIARYLCPRIWILVCGSVAARSRSFTAHSHLSGSRSAPFHTDTSLLPLDLPGSLHADLCTPGLRLPLSAPHVVCVPRVAWITRVTHLWIFHVYTHWIHSSFYLRTARCALDPRTRLPRYVCLVWILTVCAVLRGSRITLIVRFLRFLSGSPRTHHSLDRLHTRTLHWISLFTSLVSLRTDLPWIACMVVLDRMVFSFRFGFLWITYSSSHVVLDRFFMDAQIIWISRCCALCDPRGSSGCARMVRSRGSLSFTSDLCVLMVSWIVFVFWIFRFVHRAVCASVVFVWFADPLVCLGSSRMRFALHSG